MPQAIWLHRNVENHLIDLMKYFPVTVITGARQIGKTTLAKKVAPHFHYIDLEKPSHFDQLTYDPEFFFSQHPESLIIDEAQKWPALFDILRGVIDEKREQPGRFIITGSSMALLSQVANTLAGRVAIIELGTLKMNEYYQKPISSFYDLFKTKLHRDHVLQNPSTQLNLKEVQHVWLNGGYPEPLLKNNVHFRELWMSNYQATYINRDIAQLFPKLNLVSFRRFISMLAKLSGTIINKSDVARSLAVTEPTVSHYLDIVHHTFLWRRLLSAESNITKSLVKMPKGYIRDTGLLHHLLRITDLESLRRDPIAGFSFENFVCEEIIKGIQDSGVTNTDYFYYRTRGGAEIDLVIEGPFGCLPIEIKLGQTVQLKQLTALIKFVEDHQLPFGMLINQSQHIQWLTPKIVQIPVGFL